MITTRRYDLDWLRVIAFFILIYFHSAIIFMPGGLPLIQNADTSYALEVFVNISSQFRLALLFFISGVGVAFARKRRSNKAFIKERSRRLLIPLLVGILLIVPPMVYTEKLFLGEFVGSFLAFYPSFFTQGTYPVGNLSWHHFWFIVYLYIFCLMGIKVFAWMENAGKQRLAAWVEKSSGLGIYGFILVLLAVEIPLRAVFPGFRDLIHDWASFSHWFLMFMFGFVVANHAHILDNARRLRYISLTGAVLATSLSFVLFGRVGLDVDMDDPLMAAKYLLFCVIRMTLVWCSILTCVGFAAKYLRFNHPLLSFVNEAVFPLFILHLTIITIVGYWVVDQSWHLWLKYLFVTSTTIVSVLLIYQVCIRPFNFMRLLFGVKPKASIEPVTASLPGKKA